MPVNGTTWRKLAWVPRETKFDNDNALLRIKQWAGGSQEKYASAFLWHAGPGAGLNPNNYRLPVGDIYNGKLTLVPRAIFSAATILSGAHGGLVDVVSEDERNELKRVLTQIYDQFREKWNDRRQVPPWLKGGNEMGQVVASLNLELRELPRADVGTAFNSEAAKRALWQWADGDIRQYRRGFAIWDVGDPHVKSTYKYPIAVPDGNELRVIPAAVTAAMETLSAHPQGMNAVDGLHAPMNALLATLHSPSSRTVSTWTENQDFYSRARIAGKTSIAGDRRPGDSAVAALTSESGLDCLCPTSSALTAESPLNPAGDSGKQSAATPASIPARNTSTGSGQSPPTPPGASESHGTSGSELIGADSGSVLPPGGGSLAFLDSSGSTSPQSTQARADAVPSVQSPLTSPQGNLERQNRPTLTTATTNLSSGDSSAPPAIGGLEPSSTSQNSSKKHSSISESALMASNSHALNCQNALVAAGGPVKPPTAWFQDPRLQGPTPLSVSEEGRVIGHLALFNSCHAGIGDRCVMAPRSAVNYKYFTNGSVLTADGSMMRVGKLTMGTGHADTRLGYVPASDHYDNTGTAIAITAAGEDRFGIWVAGSVVPDAKEAQVQELRRSPISGDWRRIHGNLELVAALAVNTPGFPIVSMTASGEYDSICAVGVVGEDGLVFNDASIPLPPSATATLDLVAKLESDMEKLLKLSRKAQLRTLLKRM